MAIPHEGTGHNGKGRPPEAPLPPGPGATRFSTGTGTGLGRFFMRGPPSTDDPAAKAAAEAAQRDWKNVEDRISALLKKTADADARYEIARIINVMPQESERHESADLLKKIKFALDALEEPAPNPETARGIIRQIEVASRKSFTGVFRPFHRLIGTTALNAILAGLLVNLLLAVVGATIFVLLADLLASDIAIHAIKREVVWVAAFAYVGSLASLLLKLENYAKERSDDCLQTLVSCWARADCAHRIRLIKAFIRRCHRADKLPARKLVDVPFDMLRRPRLARPQRKTVKGAVSARSAIAHQQS